MHFKKPVPFEALIPFGIIAGFFGASGAGMHLIKYYTNDRKVRHTRIETIEYISC